MQLSTSSTSSTFHRWTRSFIKKLDFNAQALRLEYFCSLDLWMALGRQCEKLVQCTPPVCIWDGPENKLHLHSIPPLCDTTIAINYPLSSLKHLRLGVLAARRTTNSVFDGEHCCSERWGCRVAGVSPAPTCDRVPRAGTGGGGVRTRRGSRTRVPALAQGTGRGL